MYQSLPTRAALALLVAASAGCHRHRAPSLHPGHLPPLGTRVVVLAPHPDDEVLGAAGVLAAAARTEIPADVVVATDGEAGRDHRARAPRDLASAREAESLRALAGVGVPASAVHFLRYADAGLATAWSERWTTRRGDGRTASGQEVLDDLETAIGDGPTTMVLPSVLDEHGDHAALARFGLLAVLAARPRAEVPHVLGYLIHAGRGWPERPLPDACRDALFPWVALPLAPADVQEKAALIGEYESQVGPHLLHFAQPREAFTVGLVVRAGRPARASGPRVERSVDAVVVELPRTACLLGADRAAHLRLRFPTATGVEERRVTPGAAPEVSAGTPGGARRPASDVRVESTDDAERLVLAGGLPGERGALLEVVPGTRRDPAPAWLLLW